MAGECPRTRCKAGEKESKKQNSGPRKATRKQERSSRGKRLAHTPRTERETGGERCTEYFDLCKQENKDPDRDKATKPSETRGPRHRRWGDGFCPATLIHAPKEFVTHTVLRLKELAKERRFQDLLKKSNKQEATVQEKEKLREQWSDELSDGEQERYQGLISCWDCAKDHHIERLGGLLEASLHKNEIDQDELEIRLRQFTFINDPTTSKEKNKGQDTNTSFKDVVSGTDNKWPTATEGEKVYQKWYELCMRPAEPIRVLREMTDEEKQAIEMILNHQLEVPIPPRFLIQIMDARELAVFTDLFMAIEYPLYAHLLRGQRYGPT